jgi:CubicO group peptidase (beta-lactamase class C family)
MAACVIVGALAACERPRSMDPIDSLFAAFDKPGMPGASVVVIRDGNVIVRRSYGLADVDSGTVVSSATNFRLASLSKAFTAAAVLLHVADGKIALDDPAVKYLPELPPHARAVTLRHLLTHTSGVWDYEDFVPDTQTYQVKDADVLRLIGARAESLYFAPGTAWRYSNSGYALLALIVERVAGERYAQVLQRRIFAPLGMGNSVAYEAGVSTVAHRAYGHRVRGDSVRRADQSNTSAVLGDGGIYSSIDDLVRWDAALAGGTLLPDSLWREATTPYQLTDRRATEYGYGWFIDRFDGHLRQRHHGETRGFTNSIYRFPEDRLTTIVLTNRSDSAPWELNDEIARTYLARAPADTNALVRGR